METMTTIMAKFYYETLKITNNYFLYKYQIILRVITFT